MLEESIVLNLKKKSEIYKLIYKELLNFILSCPISVFKICELRKEPNRFPK